MTGSALVVRAASIEEVKELIDSDIYTESKVVGEIMSTVMTVADERWISVGLGESDHRRIRCTAGGLRIIGSFVNWPPRCIH